MIRREKAEKGCRVHRRISSDWAVCSEALAFAADAAIYVLIGISRVFFLIMTHSDLAVASQEIKPAGHAAIRSYNQSQLRASSFAEQDPNDITRSVRRASGLVHTAKYRVWSGPRDSRSEARFPVLIRQRVVKPCRNQ